jgi:hypothetical protein
MPLLDVSDVLFDPDFADSLVCIRQTQTVGSDGIATNATQSVPFVGVVTADRGVELARLAAGSHVSGSILVHTVFRLTNGGPNGVDSDHVVWNGSEYIVTSVNDYSTYGAGFVCASCDLLPLSG